MVERDEAQVGRLIRPSIVPDTKAVEPHRVPQSKKA